MSADRQIFATEPYVLRGELRGPGPRRLEVTGPPPAGLQQVADPGFSVSLAAILLVAAAGTGLALGWIYRG